MHSTDNRLHRIRFVARYAPMTILAAKEPEQYADLEEIVSAQEQNAGKMLLNIDGCDCRSYCRHIDIDEIMDGNYDLLKEQLRGMISAQLGK